MDWSKQGRLDLPEEVRHQVKELSVLLGKPMYRVVSEAVGLYRQVSTVIDVEVAEQPPDFSWMTKEAAAKAEQEFLYDNGYLHVSEAMPILERSSKWYLHLERNGFLLRADGTDIPVYRSIRGKNPRWFSPQALWEIATVLKKQRRYKNTESARVFMRIQQLFIQQQARQNLARLKKKKG